jgi:hypothetical protein
MRWPQSQVHNDKSRLNLLTGGIVLAGQGLGALYDTTIGGDPGAIGRYVSTTVPNTLRRAAGVYVGGVVRAGATDTTARIPGGAALPLRNRARSDLYPLAGQAGYAAEGVFGRFWDWLTGGGRDRAGDRPVAATDRPRDGSLSKTYTDEVAPGTATAERAYSLENTYARHPALKILDEHGFGKVAGTKLAELNA